MAQETFFLALGRIILSAGTAKVAIDTPQAVSSLEQADLDRLQANSIGDVLKGIPGVQGAGASTRPLGQAFNIRGIGNAEQTASEARIAVTVDGAPKFFESYRMGSFFGDLELFKRVEVLRGAASSTLYGAGAIGGVVNFTTKDPADFLGEDANTVLRFKAGYNSNGDTAKLGLIWAQRLGAAEVLGALNFSDGGEMVDGDGDAIAGSEHRSWSGLAKGVWHFGNDDDQTLTFSMSRTDTSLDDATVAQTGDLQFFGTTPASALATFGTNDIDAVDDTVTLAWRHQAAANPFIDLTVQLSYTDTSVEKRDFSMAAGCRAGDSMVLCDSDYAYTTTALKIENTADLSGGNWKNFLTFGMQISSQDRTAYSIAPAAPGALPFHPEGKDQKTGIYAQGEFTWNDKLMLMPGVRVDFGNFSPSADAAANGGTDKSETAISPKLAALYKVNDQFSVFGSVAHTERMPSLDEYYQYNPTAGRVPVRTASMDLNKEQADTVELGFAWQKDGLLAADDSLRLKVTAFHNDMTDRITVRPSSQSAPGQSYYYNLNSAQIWGVELEADYDAERWFAQAAFANIRSRDTTVGSANYGRTLADTPAESLVLTVGAKLPEQNLVIGWRGSWFDDITTSALATSADGYNVHDVFLTWKPEEGAFAGMEVNFTVENVFDTNYRNNLTLDNGAGRNAKLTLARNFTW